MDCGKEKKLHKLKITEDEEDRISNLSDDLIHEILLFLEDTRFAVQTCILSKRWKCVWETLPYLNFRGCYHRHYIEKLNKSIHSKFINYVLTQRNHQCQLRKLDLYAGLPVTCMRRYIKYAILHNVETLYVDLDRYFVLSMFNSTSLKELKLAMPFKDSDVMESDCWRLPNLTTLYLKQSEPFHKYRVNNCGAVEFVGRFPQTCLSCLSALTTLGLNNCILPEFFSLSCLTTLYLVNCTLPKTVWELPALLTLELDDVSFPYNMSEYFLALANLRNLAIDFSRCGMRNCVISGYQLVNLKIRASQSIVIVSETKFVVSAPKLCNFTAIGFFPITFEGCELENVEIEFFKSYLYCVDKKKVLKNKGDLFKMMFGQLGSAKNLTLDFETLEELSTIPDLLELLECPFYSLKHLKLPLGYKASYISSIVRQYLLGASPKACIVETLGASSQVNVIPQITPVVSTSAQMWPL